MWYKHRHFKSTEWSVKQLWDVLRTLTKDRNLSRWHSQRQVQDCYEWCFWSLPKCQMFFLNVDFPDLGIYMTIWSTVETMEEKGPLIVYTILPYVQYKQYVTFSQSCPSDKKKNWIYKYCELRLDVFYRAGRGTNRNAKLRQSTDADTEATEFILHCSASLIPDCSSGCLDKGSYISRYEDSNLKI